MAIDYDGLSVDFAVNGWKWKLDNGEQKIPDADDIAKAINSMRKTLLESGEDQCQITMGRLIMQKNFDHYDVYVWSGELNGEES